MNNKKLGSSFEKEICEALANDGWWVHFISPDVRGAQPFDIIAVKDNSAVAIECKTLSDAQRYFRYDRLEDNQKFACEKWIRCGNSMPLIAVKHHGYINFIRYEVLKENGKIDLGGIEENEASNESHHVSNCLFFRVDS